MSRFEEIVGSFNGPEMDRAAQEERKRMAFEDLRQALEEVREGAFPVSWLIEPLARYGAFCALDIDRVGVYLAAHLCAQPDDRMVFAHSLLTRDLQRRDDIWSIAEQELRQGIDSLDEDEQKQIWSLLATG